MNSFTDNRGRKWEVAVTVAVVKRVKATLNVDLLSVVEGKDLLLRLQSDPLLLCDVLFVVVKQQADAAGISDEDFGAALAGDAIADAAAALLDALVNFFPSPKRTILESQLKKLRTFEAAILQQVQAKLDSPELDATLKAAISKALDRPLPTFGESPTKPPESSA